MHLNRRSTYGLEVLSVDHSTIARWVLHYDPLHTIQGYKAMHMLRKGQIRWVKRGDIAEHVRFVNRIFGLAA